jgi:hypothetical protein
MLDKITYVARLVLLFLTGVLVGLMLAALTSVKQHTTQLTSKDALEIFKEFKKYTGAPDIIPSLSIQDDSVVNAYASSNEIIVTTGMLNFCKSKDELAAIIGHEMGHVIMNHVNGARAVDQRLDEANSDKFGIYLMLRANYNVCDARKIWLRLREEEGDNTITKSHPDYSFREWSLTFPQCE